ncbi:SMP-30/gluconolactonase/LRE family protein (plasmid) [Streptomyces sp. BI20]|uniref:SMP-30/gluconolactonase/LRE family protein n=1 Tax=Streptomyces sp. BI20 TaxID=3403460 RepID=UPI003C791F9B
MSPAAPRAAIGVHEAVPVATVPPSELGEGPRHDPRDDTLLWVDIPAGLVHRAHWRATGPTLLTTHDLSGDAGAMVGALAPLPDPGTGWSVTREDALLHLAPDGTTTVLDRPEAGRGTRFNDGACDPLGRFWIGSTGRPVRPGAGRLLRRDTDGTVRVLLPHVTISNGIDFSPDGRRAYYTDTATHRIDVLDLDRNGEITDRRVLARFDPARDGVPDGLTVDHEGCVWVAMWDGWCVRRLAPDGTLLARVDTPVSRPTACCFHHDTLVITSAREGLDPGELARQPDAGRLFLAHVGVGGPPARPHLGPIPTPNGDRP